ncbi:hypothetical protein AB1I63_01040 [Streptococcus pneumoniae]
MKKKDFLRGLIENPFLPYVVLLLWGILFTVLSYMVINAYQPAYDFDFHAARLVGLAQSLANGDLLPNVNSLFSYGTGYASAMFYGNWQFYLPAVLYNAVRNINIAYAFFAFLLVVFDSMSTYYCFSKMTKNKKNAFIVALIIPCFYPAFGFGMTMIVGFVPMLYYALYKVLYENKTNPILLAVIVALLVQTHILSTIVLAISSFIFLVLNGRKVKIEHLMSFGVSAILGILLASGYLIQYLEQVKSQSFYFSWVGRDFPVDSQVMFDLKENFHSGFASLTNFYDLVLKVAVFYFLYRFQSLKSLSKSLLVGIVILYVSMTRLLPWESLLRYSFLGSLQYTERLSFFLPILVLLIVVLEVDFSVLKGLVVAILSIYCMNHVYEVSVKHMDASLQLMRERNQRFSLVTKNPESVLIDPIGDEYYNLDVRHENVRVSDFKEFSNQTNVFIKNVKKSYNKLEFDVELLDNHQSASVVLPLVWYKGYVADYSNGASGSQPMMAIAKRTETEIKEMRSRRMPIFQNKVLHDGKIYLTISTSGHVVVRYQKTFLQYVGYSIECMSWGILLLIGIYRWDMSQSALTAMKKII